MLAIIHWQYYYHIIMLIIEQRYGIKNNKAAIAVHGMLIKLSNYSNSHD